MFPRLSWLLLFACTPCDERGVETAGLLEGDGEDSPPISWAPFDVPAAPGALGVSLGADAEGLSATWIEPVGEAHRVRFARWTGEWSSPIDVARGENLVANWADFPRGTRGGNGSFYVSHLHRTGELPYAYAVHLSRIDDANVTDLGVVHRDGTPTEHGFVSMVPTEVGIRLFWLDGRATGDGGATQVFTTTVDGSTIAPAMAVDERVCDCCQTDAAIGPRGAMVAFRDRGPDEVRDIAVAHASGDAFGSPSLVHDDGWEIAGCPVNGPALAADEERSAIAWFTGATGGTVRAAFDQGNGFGEPFDVDPNQPPGRVDMALVPGGAAVSWLARGRERGEVRVRFVSPTGEIGRSTVVGTTGVDRGSGFPVMTRWREHLYVAWRSEAALRMARLRVDELPRTPAPVGTDDDDGPQVREGEAPPQLRIRRADDSVEPLGFEKPTLVAFFARWCQPCREELRELEALRKELADEVRVIAVGLDEGSAARVERTARSWAFEGEVLRDAGAAAAVGVPPLPGIVVVVDGRSTLVRTGELVSPDELRRALSGERVEETGDDG